MNDITNLSPTATLLTTPRKIPVGAAIDWFKTSWPLVKKDFKTWLLIMLMLLVVGFVLSLLPWVGSIVISLFSPVIMGGLLVGIHASATQNKPLTIDTLSAGFNDKLINLIIIGAIATAISFIVAAISGEVNSDYTAKAINNTVERQDTLGYILYTLFETFLNIVFMLAFFFTTPLIVFNNLSIMDAIKASFNAGVKNILPLVVYSIIATILVVLGALPLLLGLLVVIPLVIVSNYYAYRDVFVE